MTNKELIEILSKYDPDQDVYFVDDCESNAIHQVAQYTHLGNESVYPALKLHQKFIGLGKAPNWIRAFQYHQP